ncbi:MAG: glycosyltransferase family A protein, partial [Solirubrobacteraceae bacterium]
LIAFNRPDLLSEQVRAFRRNLVQPHEIVVINNGQGRLAWRIGLTALRLGVRAHRVQQPNHTTANYSHARAIEFAWERFVSRDRDVSLIVDHDCFPYRRFSPRELLAGAAMAGVAQLRESDDGRRVHYLAPSLLVLDLPKLPRPESVSFWPDRVDGITCDVGGHLWEYWRRRPGLRVRHLDQGYIEVGDARLLMETFGGTFIHYLGGSNWNSQPEADHAAKTEWMVATLRTGVARAAELPGSPDAGEVITVGSLFRSRSQAAQ